MIGCAVAPLIDTSINTGRHANVNWGKLGGLMPVSTKRLLPGSLFSHPHHCLLFDTMMFWICLMRVERELPEAAARPAEEGPPAAAPDAELEPPTAEVPVAWMLLVKFGTAYK